MTHRLCKMLAVAICLVVSCCCLLSYIEILNNLLHLDLDPIVSEIPAMMVVVTTTRRRSSPFWFLPASCHGGHSLCLAFCLLTESWQSHACSSPSYPHSHTGCPFWCLCQIKWSINSSHLIPRPTKPTSTNNHEVHDLPRYVCRPLS